MRMYRRKICKTLNANQVIVFGNAELEMAIHRFFVKWENKNCEVLACTHYIRQPENNFFNMKSGTI